MTNLLHEKYLPFTEAELRQHFAHVAGAGEEMRHLAYYKASIKAEADYLAATAPQTPPAVRRGLQMQKDERFWIAATLMTLFHSPNRLGVLGELLQRCFGPTPNLDGLSSWTEALGVEQHLFFEANLAAPKKYREWLSDHLDERVLIPYVREAAGGKHVRFEGQTKTDAILVCDTGFAVVFEARSCRTSQR